MAIPEYPEGISLPIKDQIEEMLQLLNKKGDSHKLIQASMASIDNIYDQSQSWIIDSGTFDHMTNEGTIVTEYTKLLMPKYVKLVDATCMKIIGK